MQKAERRKIGAVALGSGCSTPFTRSGSWFLDAASHRFPLALPLALSARTWLEDVDSVLLRLSLASLSRSPVAEVVLSEITCADNLDACRIARSPVRIRLTVKLFLPMAHR